MKIAIVGGNGFLGGHLREFLAHQSVDIVLLERGDFAGKEALSLIKSKIQGCDVIINLAGARVAKRWTEAYKPIIYSSRIDSTRLLVSAINSLDKKPKLFISMSAVGYYPKGGTYTEKDTVSGDDFLARVCFDWEAEASKVSSEVRLAIARSGVVLAGDGGALPKIMIPFSVGIGAHIGLGTESFSWIHIDDLMWAMRYIIDNENISGVVNFTTPELTTLGQLNRSIAEIMGVSCCVPIPPFITRIAVGEGYSVLIAGRNAIPEKLINNGYIYKYPKIKEALQSLIR